MSGGGAVQLFAAGGRTPHRPCAPADARSAFKCAIKRPSTLPHWKNPILRLTSSRVYCVAQNKQEPNSEKSRLDTSAEDYLAGLEAGLTPDEIVSRQLGIEANQELTDAQSEYLNKAKKKIAERAEAIKNERKAAENVNLKYGKYAYGKGEYSVAVEALEKAIEECGSFSANGGEASLWLALAYQAVGREEDCIALYKELKERHVSNVIRKRAAELLYIMEAPKLKVSQEEKVKVPVMENADRWSPRGSYGPRQSGRPIKPKKKVKKSLEDKFWDEYQPPQLIPNRYVWIASSVLAVGLAWYSSGMSR